MNIGSPVKAKDNLMKSNNISQKATEAISMAFEETIKSHQRDLQGLKSII